VRELRTEIEIDTPPEQVWRVLTDFGAYRDWNPFIRSIEGKLQVGERLKVRITPPDSRAMTFRPTVRAAEPARELRWLGRLLVPGLFDGEHRLALEPLEGGRSRFTQSERFSGLLVGLLGGAHKATERGFDGMNEALKRRAERTPAGEQRPRR
jgi:hypothetical protein